MGTARRRLVRHGRPVTPSQLSPCCRRFSRQSSTVDAGRRWQMSSQVADRALALPRHAARGRSHFAVPAGLGIALACVALTVIGYRDSKPSDMNGLGLLHALPTGSLIGLGGLTTVLVLSLHSRNVSPGWLYVQLGLLVSALALAPALMEPNPRFATAWQHAGFADYIARNHHILAHTDARFSWPAFFAA